MAATAAFSASALRVPSSRISSAVSAWRSSGLISRYPSGSQRTASGGASCAPGAGPQTRARARRAAARARMSLRGEVARLGVVKDERGDRSLRIHHETFRQLDADLSPVDETEERGLIGEVGAGRIPEAVALAAVPALEAVDHRDLRRVREPPRGPKLRMEPLGGRFGRLDGEGLQGM